MGVSHILMACPSCGAENSPEAQFCANCGIPLTEHQQHHGNPSAETEQEYGLHRCATHPEVETGLACGRCGKYICPRCMIQTPVGGRCHDCARVTKLPTYDVRPTYYIRAATVGGITAIVSGIVWGVLLSLHIPFLPWLSAIGTGYVVGEAISAAVNRKRGTGLAVVAGASMTLAALVSGLLGSVFVLGNIFGLITLGIAFYVAINRVR